IRPRLLLNWSSDTTSAGLVPDCSCPTVGSRSAYHISPRSGLATGSSSLVHESNSPVFIPPLVSVEAVHKRTIPFANFILIFFPCHVILLQRGVCIVCLFEHPFSPIFFYSFVRD